MNRHYWYYRYKPDVDWLNDHIDDIEDAQKALMTAVMDNPGVVTGMVVAERGAGQNFSVDVSSGTAFDVYGQRIFNSATTNVPFTTDALGAAISCTGGGNERIVSVYAYYNVVDSDDVVDGNGDTVQTVGTETVEFQLRQGSIASAGSASPAADPADGGVLLAHVTIATGDSTIATANCNNGPKKLFRTTPTAAMVDKHLRIFSSHPIVWSGTQVTAGADINIVCVDQAGAIKDGTIASGAFALSDGECLIVRLDRSNTGVTYDSVTYGSLAAGKYAITAIANLGVTDSLDADDIILFRRHDIGAGADVYGVGFAQLELPIFGAMLKPGDTAYFGRPTLEAFKRLYLDVNGAANGDTYLEEVSANIARILAGGAEAMRWTTGGAAIPATKRLYLDGGGNTSIRESGADTIAVEVGGTDHIVINSAGELRLPNVDTPTANYLNRNSGAKAWLHWQEGSPGSITASYNIDTVTDEATDGQYTVTLDTNMAADYAYTAVASSTGFDLACIIETGLLAGEIDVRTFTHAGTGTDESFYLVVYGAQ